MDTQQLANELKETRGATFRHVVTMLDMIGPTFPGWDERTNQYRFLTESGEDRRIPAEGGIYAFYSRKMVTPGVRR